MKRRSLVLAALLMASMLVAIPLASTPATAAIPERAFSPAKAFEYARQSGKPVEISSQTNPVVKSWAQPDGQTKVMVSAAPVRMRRGGEWVDFDMTLQRREDGTIAPKVHPHDLVLAGASDSGDHVLASVLLDGQRRGLSWRGRLPEPQLDGATATYVDVVPGIDLVVEARTGGFEQFIVVKRRSAAARVAALRLGVHDPEGRFDAGQRAWTDARGKELARMPEPVMWDAQPLDIAGEHPRRAPVDVRDSIVRPNQSWLDDPATVYPVTIDPGLSTPVNAGFDEFVQNTINISDNQGSTELKVGYIDSSDCLAITSAGCRARSYLRFDGFSGFGGANLTEARLYLWQFHSYSCNSWNWRASRTDHVEGWVQWGNEPTIREDGPWSSETTGYNSSCNDGWVSTDIKNLLDDVIATNGNSLSLVVRAEGDNGNSSWSPLNRLSWKKFSSAEAAAKPTIWFTYNHLPTVSNLTVNDDSTCAVGQNRLYLPMIPTTATIAAKVDDPNGANNHVRLEVELTPAGGTPQTFHSANGPAGSVRSVTIPNLDTSKIYTYRVRGQDIRASDGVLMDSGAWTAPCEFGFDDFVLAPPTVTGLPSEIDEFGDRYYVMNYGQPIQLTITAHPDDVGKVAGYRYGFGLQDDDDDPVVLARPDGSATVTITNWQADAWGVPDWEVSPIYVTALSITGHQQSQWSRERIFNFGEVIPPTSETPGDLSGDGKADLAAVQTLANGHDILHVRRGNQNGTLDAPLNLRTETNYATKPHQYLQGDFNGDGFTDILSLVTGDNTDQLDVIAYPSDGNALAGASEVWHSPTGWPYARAKPSVGDVNGDGRDDLIVALGNSAGTTYQLKVFLASGISTIAFDAPVDWLASAATGNVANLKLVTGNFDGSGGDDVGVFEKTATCSTRLFFHHNSNSTGFGAATAPTWSSSGWCWDDSTFVAGDFDLVNGRTGIVATAFNRTQPACHTDVYTFTAPFTSFATQHNTAKFCAGRVQPVLRDIAGDERPDLVLINQDATLYQQHVWTLTAAGAPGGPDTFADPVLTQQGRVGPLGTNPESAANLAIGATATGSTACASNEGPANAIDGTITNVYDKWCSLVPSPWLQVDLGGVRTVSSVVVRHAGSGEWTGWNTKDFSVLTSVDGSTWQTVATVTNNTASVTKHTFSARNARYVKVSISTPTQDGSAAARIFQVEVYAGTPAANLALNRPATSSTPCGSGEGPAKALNGTFVDIYDKWCSATSPLWMQVDLGSVKSIGTFMVWHASSGGESSLWNTRDYNIRVSNDGSTWTTLYTVTGNTASVTHHTLGLAQARYVRLEVVTPTQNGNVATRIFEFEVFEAA